MTTNTTSIAQNLADEFEAVQRVINCLEPPFTSHKFIQEFSHLNETLYLSFLARYQRPNGVRSVNSQIGRFLSVNSDWLGLQKTGKKNDGNFFGKNSGNERWERR
jgi:hypothetical protein